MRNLNHLTREPNHTSEITVTSLMSILSPKGSWRRRQTVAAQGSADRRAASLSFHEVVSLLVGSVDPGHVEIRLQGHTEAEK